MTDAPQTRIELHYGDGEYVFTLKLPQLAELQEKRECGIFAIYSRVMKGRGLYEGQLIELPTQAAAYAEDLFETIRLGLLGGGQGMVDGQPVVVTPLMARQLVERYSMQRPLKEAWATAAAILGAMIIGYTPPKAEPALEPGPDAETEPTETVST